MRNAGFFMKAGFNTFIGTLGSKLYVTKTAGEFLFDGYDDPLLHIKPPPSLGIDVPPYDKFGWFYLVSNIFCTSLRQ